jgi:hypothetical protein
VDSGDFSDDLDVWVGLPGINTLRDGLAADIVVFVTGSALASGEFEPGTEFAIIGAQAPPIPFAHEVGHVLGLQHDWARCLAVGACVIPASWSTPGRGDHGWVRIHVSNTSAVRSIMSYLTACDDAGVPTENCDWLPRWSNPNQSIDGLAFGKPEGLPFPSDEVLHLNVGRIGIANARKSACRLLSSC